MNPHFISLNACTYFEQINKSEMLDKEFRDSILCDN